MFIVNELRSTTVHDVFMSHFAEVSIFLSDSIEDDEEREEKE